MRPYYLTALLSFNFILAAPAWKENNGHKNGNRRDDSFETATDAIQEHSHNPSPPEISASEGNNGKRKGKWHTSAVPSHNSDINEQTVEVSNQEISVPKGNKGKGNGWGLFKSENDDPPHNNDIKEQVVQAPAPDVSIPKENNGNVNGQGQLNADPSHNNGVNEQVVPLPDVSVPNGNGQGEFIADPLHNNDINEQVIQVPPTDLSASKGNNGKGNKNTQVSGTPIRSTTNPSIRSDKSDTTTNRASITPIASDSPIDRIGFSSPEESVNSSKFEIEQSKQGETSQSPSIDLPNGPETGNAQGTPNNKSHTNAPKLSSPQTQEDSSTAATSIIWTVVGSAIGILVLILGIFQYRRFKEPKVQNHTDSILSDGTIEFEIPAFCSSSQSIDYLEEASFENSPTPKISQENPFKSSLERNSKIDSLTSVNFPLESTIIPRIISDDAETFKSPVYSAESYIGFDASRYSPEAMNLSLGSENGSITFITDQGKDENGEDEF